MSEGAVGTEGGEGAGEGAGGAEGAGSAIESGAASEGTEGQGSGVTPAPDYRSLLPDGLGQDPVFERLDSVEKLAIEHKNLQKVLGGPKMPRPAENWGEQEWSRFWEELGRPPSPDGYDFQEVSPPEGVEIDEGFRNDMVAHMHKLGLTQDQAKGVMAAYFDAVGQRAGSIQGEVEALTSSGMEELRNEFGRAFDQKLALAGRAFRELAGKNFEEIAQIQLADGRLLGDHPDVIRMMAKVGDVGAEHALFGSERESTPIMTPEEAGREERRLRGDGEFQKKLLDKHHPEHRDAVDRISQLVRLQVRDPDRSVD